MKKSDYKCVGKLCEWYGTNYLCELGHDRFNCPLVREEKEDLS